MEGEGSGHTIESVQAFGPSKPASFGQSHEAKQLLNDDDEQ